MINYTRLSVSTVSLRVVLTGRRIVFAINLADKGRTFQARVAATGKARSPNVERRVDGTISVDVEADRRRRRTSTCRTLLISRRQSRLTYCAWLLVWRITLIIISPHGALLSWTLTCYIVHRILSWIMAWRNRNCRNSACRNSACRNRNCLPPHRRREISRVKHGIVRRRHTSPPSRRPTIRVV